MGYYNDLSIDTRTCGEAAEDAALDRTDGLTTRPPAAHDAPPTDSSTSTQEPAPLASSVAAGGPLYHKDIVYDRTTRDYAMYLDGELVGFARTYHEADVTLDQLVYELISGEYFTAARPAEPCDTLYYGNSTGGLDGGEDIDPDNVAEWSYAPLDVADLLAVFQADPDAAYGMLKALTSEQLYAQALACAAHCDKEPLAILARWEAGIARRTIPRICGLPPYWKSKDGTYARPAEVVEPVYVQTACHCGAPIAYLVRESLRGLETLHYVCGDCYLHEFVESDQNSAAWELVYCDNCAAPATTAIDLIWLCDACADAATERLRAAVSGPVCLACGDPIEQDGAICEACQEAGEPWPVAQAIQDGRAASGLIPVLELHRWRHADAWRYRAALAQLSAVQLEWQAAVYAAYVETVGHTTTTEETLEHFRRSVAIHWSCAAPAILAASCPNCGGAHSIQKCPEILAALLNDSAPIEIPLANEQETELRIGPIRKLYASLAALPAAPKQETARYEYERLEVQASRLADALWHASRVALLHDLPDRQQGIYDGPAWGLYLRLTRARRRAAARWTRRVEKSRTRQDKAPVFCLPRVRPALTK